jgi:acyl-CoA reductase-like NAD-dependent aldehyde dehydrogenase
MSRSRAPVVKTYKLLIGGAFVRSESGRTDAVGPAEVPRGSRKDVRDAVKAARGAFGGWSGKTAYNRGQVLYRFAEALESRRGTFADIDDAELDAAVDLLVHHAGWTDKLHAVLGAVNPVAAPYFSFSFPEPTGVVAVLAPDEPALLGAVAELAPALAAGCSVVVALSSSAPHAGLDLGEVLEVSDVPAGVVNLLSGRREELLPALVSHRDVNAIVDATGVADWAVPVDEGAAETVKRVSRPRGVDLAEPERGGFERIRALLELKTAWHPVGV